MTFQLKWNDWDEWRSILFLLWTLNIEVCVNPTPSAIPGWCDEAKVELVGQAVGIGQAYAPSNVLNIERIAEQCKKADRPIVVTVLKRKSSGKFDLWEGNLVWPKFIRLHCEADKLQGNRSTNRNKHCLPFPR